MWARLHITYIAAGVTGHKQVQTKSPHTVICYEKTQGTELEKALKGGQEETHFGWRGWEDLLEEWLLQQTFVSAAPTSFIFIIDIIVIET